MLDACTELLMTATNHQSPPPLSQPTTHSRLFNEHIFFFIKGHIFIQRKSYSCLNLEGFDEH